jgi:hypothetical protein
LRNLDVCTGFILYAAGVICGGVKLPFEFVTLKPSSNPINVGHAVFPAKFVGCREVNMRFSIRICAAAFQFAAILSVTGIATAAPQRPVVPGSGSQLTQVGDDFEDENFAYIPNDPKSTEDIDENQRQPLGKTNNGRWYEGVKRGHPDIVKRVPTPEGGLAGSQGAMLLQSLQTGIPRQPSHKMHQDDFICNVQNKLGGPISVSQSPTCTTRVYLPPVEEWEKRNGPHFAFRAAVETTIMETKPKFLFSKSSKKEEVYWPGMFIVKDTKVQDGKSIDNIHFRIRSDRNGGDFRGPDLETTGWWTLGMSFTPDGMVHYYARPGVEDLTADDYIASQFPYGYRCERFRTFFYNTINGDNGKTWSTAFIVDDPKVYIGSEVRTARR